MFEPRNHFEFVSGHDVSRFQSFRLFSTWKSYPADRAMLLPAVCFVDEAGPHLLVFYSRRTSTISVRNMEESCDAETQRGIYIHSE